MPARIRLDHRGMGEMLRSGEVAATIALRAAEVEQAVSEHQSIVRHEMPVERHAYTSDRAGEDVTIEHAGGLAVEAKYGVLADAARAVALQVTTARQQATRRRRKAKKDRGAS
ncbi:hypothetical protein [Actinoplanes philippinensis]|uniref:hypothetical protein n=1 Tax=Actinoplanes philippinensis TaxID=35752 RepID=UPI0033E4AF74